MKYLYVRHNETKLLKSKLSLYLTIIIVTLAFDRPILFFDSNLINLGIRFH
jgi:hypothetical protein